MPSYAQKIIRSGKFIDVYTYQNSIQIGKKQKHITKKRKSAKGGKNEGSKKSDESNAKTDPPKSRGDSLTRTRQRITQIINANPELKTFVTLTYAKNNENLRDTNKDFVNFIKRLRRHFPNLAYVKVPEFQIRGAVHYHVLFNQSYIEHALLERVWSHGFVFIRKINEIENVGLYLSSYIKKDLVDNRLFGHQKVGYSSNLRKPVITKHKRPVADFFLKDVAGAKLVNENEYEGEYIGKVKWQLYRINDDNLVLPPEMS